MKIRNISIIFILIIIYIFSSLYRIYLNKNPEYYDSRDPTAFYWTENALQYHYAELIAQGKQIPKFDPKLQAPDGVRVFENLTIFMEYPCGWIYRLLNLKQKMLFHTWTIIFIACWASLGIFAIYLLCKALNINHFYSIIASLLLNFSLVAVGRSTFGFLNEDFALPFIIFGLAGYFYALRNSKNKILFSFISGFCFLISLCSWHFSRFIFLTIVLFSVFNLWVFEKNEKIRENAYVLFYTLLIPFLGSFLVPVLKSRLYFVSSPFALGFGTFLGLLLFCPKRKEPLITPIYRLYLIIIGLLFFLISIIITTILKTETEYIHFWSLIINKIKFFGIKPESPELLDYPARSLWIEAFNSPHPVSLFKNLFPIIIPAIFGFIHLLKKEISKSAVRLFLFFSLIFFLSYLAVERMGVVNNYFVIVLAVVIGTIDLKKFQGIYRYLIPAGFLIIFLFNFYQGYNLHSPTDYIKILRKIFGSEVPKEIYNWRLNDIEIVRYIKYCTPEDGIFLSSFGVGPLILTYTDRAIVLQPKFEVKDCQDRVKKFLDAIYGSEDGFYKLCKRWKVMYFLYDTKIVLDNTQDGSRWIAGKLKISTNSVAFLMHFFPEELEHFQLVYQNNFYRLFKILGGSERSNNLNYPYQLIYDIKVYGNQTKGIEFFDDRFTRDVLNKIREAKLLLQRATTILTKNPQMAIALMEKSIGLYPSLIGSATTFGIAHALAGKIETGLLYCKKEVETNPFFPLGHYNLAYCLYLKGDLKGAIEELKETLRLVPDFFPALEMLKQLQE